MLIGPSIEVECFAYLRGSSLLPCAEGVLISPTRLWVLCCFCLVSMIGRKILAYPTYPNLFWPDFLVDEPPFHANVLCMRGIVLDGS